jgi:hypothetical protein
MPAADSFHTILQRITSSELQRERVATHRDTIATRRKSHFSFYKMLTIGSYPRGRF